MPNSAELAKRSSSAEKDGSSLISAPISCAPASSWLASARMRWATAGNGGRRRSAQGAWGRAVEEVITRSPVSLSVEVTSDSESFSFSWSTRAGIFSQRQQQTIGPSRPDSCRRGDDPSLIAPSRHGEFHAEPLTEPCVTMLELVHRCYTSRIDAQRSIRNYGCAQLRAR